MLNVDPKPASTFAQPEITEQQPLAFSSAQTRVFAGHDLQGFIDNLPDLVCFSHLRWDFVYQRPQHLLSRFSQRGRVFFIEEPVFGDFAQPSLAVSDREGKLKVVVPHLPHGLSQTQIEEHLRSLITDFISEQDIQNYIGWYYSPMFLEVTNHLRPSVTVYDCMDELAAFKGAPPRLRELEGMLFQKADLVFTGGVSLYEAKKSQHPRVHAFPSSIDRAHFGQARAGLPEPEDQKAIPHPRLGFFGVVDERFDIDLIGQVAAARPDWHLVIIGPVVKIDPATLPRHANIHYLGGKSYQELPAYLSSWDVAMLPFARNESTQFISPTKTPEYLAAGKPVVSTSIRDVVRPYGEQKLVHIADEPEAFVKALENALAQATDEEWKARTDAYLSTISWDKTWHGMVSLIYEQARQAAG